MSDEAPDVDWNKVAEPVVEGLGAAIANASFDQVSSFCINLAIIVCVTYLAWQVIWHAAKIAPIIYKSRNDRIMAQKRLELEWKKLEQEAADKDGN